MLIRNKHSTWDISHNYWQNIKYIYALLFHSFILMYCSQRVFVWILQHLFAHPRTTYVVVVWWCQLWKRFLPPPRAPDTIFSANADAVDNRGKGRGLSTLSSKCTHCYFLSTLLLCSQLGNIGQRGRLEFRVSGPLLTMIQRWGLVYWAWRVQVLWKTAKNEHGGTTVHTHLSKQCNRHKNAGGLLRTTATKSISLISQRCPYGSFPLLLHKWSNTVIRHDVRHLLDQNTNSELTLIKQQLLIPPQRMSSPLIPVPVYFGGLSHYKNQTAHIFWEEAAAGQVFTTRSKNIHKLNLHPSTGGKFRCCSSTEKEIRAEKIERWRKKICLYLYVPEKEQLLWSDDAGETLTKCVTLLTIYCKKTYYCHCYATSVV